MNQRVRELLTTHDAHQRDYHQALQLVHDAKTAIADAEREIVIELVRNNQIDLLRPRMDRLREINRKIKLTLKEKS